jgi:tetratricopeptide (TPR) repeat protein
MSRGCSRLSLLACLALAIACSTPEERFARHVERAQTHLDEGRADDAMIELQSALKLDPADPDVNEQLGELLRDRGTHQAAAFHFGEAYRLDPQRIDAGLAQAELLIETAPQRANQLIAQARDAHPDEPRVYRSESRLAVKLGDPERALAAARQGAELAPDDPDSWSQIGSAYVALIKQQRKEGAPEAAAFEAGLAAFRRVDEMSGGHVGARIEAARLLGRWPGHHEEAVASYRSAIALAKEKGGNTGIAFAAMRFARYGARVGDPRLRAEALREIVQATPERVQIWEQLARAVNATEGAEASETVYRELLESQAESPVAHAAYTNFLANQDRELDAIAHLDRMITDGLDEPILWEQLVRLEIAERRMADARASLEEMRSRHGDAVATHRATARVALREERFPDAIAALQNLGSDTTAETERLRALAEAGAGNFDAARAAVARALNGADRGDLATLRLKASIEDEAGDPEAVLESLAQIETLGHELSAHENVVRARALYETDRAAEGRETLIGVLDGQFPPPIAAVEFARREGSESPQIAHGYLRKALRLAPGNFSALESITDLELRSNQAASALARLDKLVESQLAGPNVLLLRARILAAAGQLDRAEADALRAFEASPDLDGAVDTLYGIYAAQGKLDEALASFEEADSVGVLHSGARVLLGRLYMAKGEHEKAKAMYERVIEENASATTAKNDLAFLLASSGSELDRALGLAEDAQRAKPDDPAVADTVGYVYLKKGRNEVALQQFRYAIEVGEAGGMTSPSVHYHLGLALSELGREAEARQAFEKALAIDPAFHDAADAKRRLAATGE